MPRCNVPWCGLCYAGLRGRETYRGHCGLVERAPVRKVRIMSLQRRQPQSGNPAGPLEPPEDMVDFTSTWEFLTSTVWPDTGEPRQTGTILLFAEDGRLKVCLNDRDQGVLAFSVVDAGDGVWLTVEAVLDDPKTVWRANRQQRGARK